MLYLGEERSAGSVPIHLPEICAHTLSLRQIPSSTDSKEKSAFSTPYGLYQFRVIPIQGYTNSEHPGHIPVTQGPGAAIIHSDTWPQHLYRVVAVLESLRKAVLTANLKECVIVWSEIQYLGYGWTGNK